MLDHAILEQETLLDDGIHFDGDEMEVDYRVDDA